MNKRINELALQARSWAEEAYKKQNDQFTSHWDNPIGYTPSQFFEQKFAELIVRECAMIATDCNSDMTAAEVLKHFGVKMKPYHEQFRLTEHHITLLQAMYCSFDDSGYEGAPAINLKRPYGNSDVYGDITDLIFNGDSDMPDDLLEACATLHKETGKALQVCLSTLSFKPGLYGRPQEFCTRTWEWISE